MKKILSILALSAVLVFTAGAQTSLDYIRENPLRAAGNLHAYEPLDTTVTPAPAGYEPFYISHCGRHGSRYHTSASVFDKMEMFAKYSEAGLLTETGERVYADLKAVREACEGKTGLLTEKGAAEHRAISARMFRHYPEVFSSPDRKDVVAVSTAVGRVISSRDSFCDELQKNAPDLNILRYLNKDKDKLANAWQEVNGYPKAKDEKEFLRQLSDSKKKSRFGDRSSRPDFSRLRKEWFKETEERISSRIFPTAYGIGKIAQCLDIDIDPFEKYFTPEELYHFWKTGSNFDWYLRCCVNIDNNGTGVINPGGGILQAIIDDADAAIKGSSTAATLRFTHDGYVLPLMSMMGVDGVSYTGAVENCSESFRDFQNICMGGNIQMVFYRNKRNDVIVKVLKNEKEVTVPGVKPFKGNYYKWNDLKKFFEKRLAGNL